MTGESDGFVEYMTAKYGAGLIVPHADKTAEPPVEFCHPGDDRRKRWILLFEDPDQGMNIYYDEVDAHQAFEMATTNWNCHLFVSAPRRADL